MDASVRVTHRLMGAMRELVSQSERVARAEARVVASRVGDVAELGGRRMALSIAATVFGTLAFGFLLVVAYDALCFWVPGWEAALIVAGGALLLAALSGWIASTSPSVTAFLRPQSVERGERR